MNEPITTMEPTTPSATRSAEYGSVIAESAVYALRASVVLAAAEQSLPASRIATQLGVPRQYLEKVLGIMARAGSVRSQRGARGGFQLAQSPEQLTLAAVIAPFDSIAEKPKCLLESRACDGVTTCAAHPYWNNVARGIHDFFNHTTIADLARVKGNGKSVLPSTPSITRGSNGEGNGASVWLGLATGGER